MENPEENNEQSEDVVEVTDHHMVDGEEQHVIVDGDEPLVIEDEGHHVVETDDVVEDDEHADVGGEEHPVVEVEVEHPMVEGGDQAEGMFIDDEGNEAVLIEGEILEKDYIDGSSDKVILQELATGDADEVDVTKIEDGQTTDVSSDSGDEIEPLEPFISTVLEVEEGIEKEEIKSVQPELLEQAEAGQVEEKRDDAIEEISATDQSSVGRVEQEVQSEPGDLALPDYSISGNLYGQISMVNTLFKKPSGDYKSEQREIQVTVYLPDNKSITKCYPANTNISELKRVVAEIMNFEPDKLLISLMGNSNGEYINDWTPLLGIPPNSVGGLVLNLSFKYDTEIVRMIDFPSGKYSPIITARQVRLKDGLGRVKTVVVITEDISYVKEWLGGFRNMATGLIYHNASTETRFWDKKQRTVAPLVNFSRDAQTHLPYLTKFTQVDANKATQMWRQDHYIQSVSDRVITAKPYVEYDLIDDQKTLMASVIKIQRWYRRMISRRNAKRTFLKLIELMKKQTEKKTAAEIAYSNEKIQYVIGICFPTMRTDFFNVYSVIGMWWKNKFNEISNMKSISERRAACYDLLLNEIELLSALEKQRINSKRDAIQRRDLKLLEETTRPLIRHQRKRNMTIVETLEVQRAREIKEMFMSYSRDDLAPKERIQVLMSLINVVETFEEIDKSKELIILMRREIDFLSMGLDKKYLQGLKKRIKEGIIYFARNSDFNPQSKNLRPIHYPRVEQRSYRCLGCRRVKNPADSAIHVRLKSYTKCRSCDWMYMTSHKVLNISPYATILKLLRAKEITKCPKSTYCFALQPFGAYFIINTIWNGKSALSENMNLPDLRLCRWNNKEGWSPWNTILLTLAEAEIHERVFDNSLVYEDDFIQGIKIKHITTRFHFKVMDETEIYCRETGLWDSAHDENIYQNMFHRREALQPVDPVFKPPINKKFIPTPNHLRFPKCVSQL